MAASSSLKVTVDLGKALQDATRALLKQDLLVGIPGDSPARPPAPGEKDPPSNAVIGYVMEHGDDEMGIPARPFLMPGVQNAAPAIVKTFEAAGRAVLDGKTGGLEGGLMTAGLAAQAEVKQKLLDGPFAPLSERTIRERAERRDADTGKLKNGHANSDARKFLKLQAEGVPEDVLHDAGLAKPLYDTHSLFNAITFVVKDKGQD